MTAEIFNGVLVSVLFLTSSGLILAGLLVVAEKKIYNYGDCKVAINNGKKMLMVKGGATLLSTLTGQSIFIPSACGGRGSCAYCKVKVLAGGGTIGPVEEPYLSPVERSTGVRLSCQVKVRGDISIEIPDELFSVKRYTGKCIKKKSLTHDIIELGIELVEPKTIDFTAGQYIQLESKEYNGREAVIRAYSVSSSPSKNNYIELIVRLVPEGICTTWVFTQLKENQELFFSGPYGHFKLSETDAPIICIAGGSGMAPIWSILQNMQERGLSRKTTYFFGARSQSDLFYEKELVALAKQNPWFTFIPALSNEPENSEWKGERGLITTIVDRHFPDLNGYEAYLCGSPGLINACIAVLQKNGIPETKIFYDKFA
ncbi:MAG: 2Fe-2S iron-sulfur cluster binding domain-containing protein [Chitinivibrionales bacterium]|nr:2Fe-2S iron-sulfur cluster binding domain-containing protein [Chitinivibrionales bacterium]